MPDLDLSPTPLPGVMLVRRRPHADERGSFARLFCADALAPVGWQGPIAQINHSRTTARGTVRGLHYQHAPAAEMKLVSCVHGQVWDVAVDLRRDSPTFLRQVNDGSTPFFVDHLDGHVQLVATVTAQRSQDVPGEAR